MMSGRRRKTENRTGVRRHESGIHGDAGLCGALPGSPAGGGARGGGGVHPAGPAEGPGQQNGGPAGEGMRHASRDSGVPAGKDPAGRD